METPKVKKTSKQDTWPPQQEWPTFLFYRREKGTEVFYPVSLPNENEVIPNVECNPGTFKVTDEEGRVVWAFQ